jgi:hypothetical protein
VPLGRRGGERLHDGIGDRDVAATAADQKPARRTPCGIRCWPPVGAASKATSACRSMTAVRLMTSSFQFDVIASSSSGGRTTSET